MKTIVITGSTRGIGFTMARSFLAKSCNVVISGRRPEVVIDVENFLAQKFSSEKLFSFPCDVTKFDQVRTLWDKAKDHFGNVDIWVNNAGISHAQNAPWKLTAEEIRSVVETNLLGELFGSKVAIEGFIKQGYGALYNMEGLGAKSRSRVKGLSVYASTKAALRYFNDALTLEIDNPKIITGSLQPGMLLTDMVTNQYKGKPEEWEKVKGILNVISGDVDEAANWLTEKMLINQKNGARFIFGGTVRMLSRMIWIPFRRD